MKVLRLVVSLLFVLATVVCGYFFVKQKIGTDSTVPVIKLEQEVLQVEINADKESLLVGVTAYDEKDGDLTDKVIVESVSNFIEPGVCRVTYAVCDSNNHVATATRKVMYKGYTSPRFSLSEDLCYSLYERLNLTTALTATDCIEGDISSNIVISSDDYTSSIEGVFNIQASVTNSKGDTSTINLPLIIEDAVPSAPKIELSEYLIYAKPNQKLNFKNYIVSAKSSGGENLTDSVKVETNIDTSKEGTYTVHYYATDENDVKGHTVLTVIVGD